MRGIETAAAALVRKIDAIGGQALSARADVADPVAGARLSRTPIFRALNAVWPILLAQR